VKYLLLPAAASLAAILPLPIEAYDLIRWIVSGVCAYACYAIFNSEDTDKSSGILLLPIVVLFNPLVPFYFTRGTWIAIDILASGLMIWFVVKAENLESRRRLIANTTLKSIISSKESIPLFDEGLSAHNVKNYSEAMRLFKLAAAKGHAAAQNNIGSMYENGVGVVQDPAEAVKWYRMAATQGNVSAQYNLGLMYTFGRGVVQNYREAMHLYSLAASRGDAEAQGNLAYMYLSGISGTQDFTEAMKWYRLAAAQGNAMAQRGIGDMYCNGKGVLQDKAEALRWYMMGAVKGDASSQYNVGMMYAKGDGVVSDYVQALMWWTLSASGGSELAVKGKDMIEPMMTPEQISEARKLSLCY
jgi:TPR repeat protein